MSTTAPHPATTASEKTSYVPTGGSPRWTWCGLGIVLLVGLCLRHHHFATVHSWFDESLGWRMAQFSPGEIIARSERNVHPPAHFLLLAGWRELFGGSLVSLRYYALVWGLATICGGYCLAREALADAGARREFAGLLAAALIALSPLHIHWSQQVKMYALGTGLTLWSSWCLLRWFRTGRTGLLAAYVPLAAVLALQHHYGTFTVFAQLTFALVWATRRSFSSSPRGEFLAVVLAGWATTALWSLWLPSFLVQRSLVQHGYWIGAFAWSDVVSVWRELFLVQTGLRGGDDVSWVIAELVLTTVLILLVQRQPGVRLLGWLVLIPFAIAVGWSVLDENVFVPRFLINAHVCLLVGVAVGISLLPRRWLRWGAAAAVLALVAFTAQRQRAHRDGVADVPGMPAAVETLRCVRADGEPVLVCNPMLYLNLCVHGEGLDDVYAFDPGHGFPHFQGAPVMREAEYRGIEGLDEAGSDWVWTLDADNWLGGTWRVRLPGKWELQHEQAIREWYATLVIRSYRRER